MIASNATAEANAISLRLLEARPSLSAVAGSADISVRIMFEEEAAASAGRAIVSLLPRSCSMTICERVCSSMIKASRGCDSPTKR